MNKMPATACPTVLYKYKDISEDGLAHFEDMLRNNRIWFSSPRDFNDPFDCRRAYDIRNTREQIVLRKAEALTRKGTPLNEAIAQANEEIPRKPIELEGWQEEQIASHNRRLANSAILCLTNICDNQIMWTHYARYHTGVCIMFRMWDLQDDSQIGFIAEAQPIEYSDRCPLVNFVQDDGAEIVRKVLLTKATPYYYEAEWRIVRYDNGPGLKSIPNGIVGGVILGVRMRPADRERVIRSCENYDGDIEIVQAQLDPDTYGLGPVIIFVSRPQGTSFAALLGHAALEQDGEVVERLFPVVNRHGPLA